MPRGQHPNSRANLHPFTKENRPTKEQQEKGNNTKREKAAERRTFKQDLEKYLTTQIKKGSETVTVQQMCAKAVIDECLRGKEKIKAFVVIRDTVGEKPVEKVMVADVDESVISEVEKMVLGGSADADK